MGLLNLLFGGKASNQTQPAPSTMTPSAPIPRFKTYDFNVVGSDHYIDNIKEIIDYNSLYELPKSEMDEGEMIFENELINDKDIALVPEPDNEYDKNAVRVDIMGKTVGYIKKGACTRVKNLLKSPNFVKYGLDSFRYGRYKELKYNYDKDNYTVEKGCFDAPEISITIIMKEEEQ